ncbi:MAG: RagB/SusD family nutrient uptake outer membrane protein [Butyricimonas faecihominis]
MTQKESAKGKKVLATAYTMRGICYYNLLRLFCEPYDKENENSQLGLPLVKVFDMEARPIRSSIKATAEFIEEDLKNGIGYNLTDDIYRLTVDVAKVYLMKLYFWTQNWGEVTTLGEELLKKYPLLEGEAYKDMIQSKFTEKEMC